MESMSSRAVDEPEAVDKADEATEPTSSRRGINPLVVLVVIVAVSLIGAGGWALWTYVGTSEMTRRAAAEEMAQLRQSWAHTTVEPGDEPQLVANPQPGTVHWMIRIPALDSSHQWPVVVGIEHLNRGPAWYSGTAQPGQVGNFAVSGHQATHGEPFAGWERLRAGNLVMVESHDAIYTYTLISSAGDLTVQADEAWVLEPVPGRDDLDATQAFITLITHEDLIPTPDRSVVFGVLTATEMK